MRLKHTLGAVCATCAATVPIGIAGAAEGPPVDVSVPDAVALQTLGVEAGAGELPDVRPIAVPLPAVVGVAAELRAAGHHMAERERLVERHLRAARAHTELAGRDRPEGLRADVAGLTDEELRRATRKLRADTRKLRERLNRKAARRASPAGGIATASPAGGGGAPNGALAAIAACESGGDPSAVSPNGMYRGKYQFSRSTWAAVGGTGDPAAAPEALQDRLAAKLYATAGAGQWPVCGR